MSSQYSSAAYTAALARRYQALLSNGQGAAGASPMSSFAPSSPVVPTRQSNTPTSLGGQLIDVLARPMYGVGRAINEVVDETVKPDTDFGQIGLAALRGVPLGVREVFAPENRQTPSDALMQYLPEVPGNAAEGTGRFIAGLAADIGLDPLTYLTAGTARAGLTAASKLPGVSRVVEGAQRGLRPLEKAALPAEVPTAGRFVGEEVADRLASSAKNARPQLEAGPIGRTQMDAAQGIKPARRYGEPLQLEPGPRGAVAMADEAAAGRTAAQNADALADGRQISVTPEGVADITDGRVFAANPAGEITRQAPSFRMVEHLGTHEVKPFRQGLLNLRKRVPVYPGIKIDDAPSLYKDVPVAPKKPPAVKTPGATEEIKSLRQRLSAAGIPSNAKGELLPSRQWVRAVIEENAPVPVAAGRTISARRLVEQISAAAKLDPKAAEAGRRFFAKAYDAYKVKYEAAVAEIKQGAVEDILGASLAQDAAKVPAQAAQAAAQALDKTRPVRVTKDDLVNVKRWINERFNSTDAKVILAAKTEEEFQGAIKAAASSKKSEPIYREIIVQAAVPASVKEQVLDILAADTKSAAEAAKKTAQRGAKTARGKKTAEKLNQAEEGLVTASEQIDNAVPGATRADDVATVKSFPEGVDDVTWSAFNTGVGRNGAQWLEHKTGFDFKTSNWQTLRDSATPGVGRGVNREAYNTMAQGLTFQDLVRVASETMPAELKAAAKGSKYPSYIKQAEWILSDEGFGLIRRMKALDKFVRANGVEPILTQTKQGWPVSLGDLLDILYNQMGHTGRSFVERRIVSAIGISKRGQKGVQGRLALTDLANAARVMLDSIDPKWTKIDDLENLVKQYVTRMARDEAEVTKALNIQGVHKIVGGARQPVEAANASAVIEEAMTTIFNDKFIHGLLQTAHNNAAHSTLQIVDQVREISSKTLNHIVSVVNDVNASVGDTVQALGKIEDGVKLASKMGEAPVAKEAIGLAAKQVKDTIPEVVSLADVQGAEHLARVQRAMDSFDMQAAVESGVKRHTQAVEAALADIPPELASDMGHAADVALQSGLLAKMAPIRSKIPEGFLRRMDDKLKTAFVAHYKNPTLSPAVARGESVLRNMTAAWREQLNYVHYLVRKGQATEDDIRIVFQRLKNQPVALNSVQEDLYERLLPAFENIFETGSGKAPGIFGAFFREGYAPQHLVNKMASSRYGLPENWVFDIKAATKNGRLDRELLANQWKNWDVKDPLEFMARMQTVAASLQLDMAVANEAVRLAKSLNRASNVRRVGFVRLDTKPGSILAHYIPKGMWFDPEIAAEIKRVDWILSQSETFNGPFGRFVNRYLDPIMNTWKAGMTVWNPGHHVRNFVGDSSLAFLASGVTNPRYYRDAIGLLAHRSKYTGWDALRALRGTNRLPVAEGEVVARTKNGLSITGGQVFNGLMDRGGLPSAAVGEDLLESIASPSIAAVQRKLAITGGRARHLVGTVTEARDDTVRLAHALHVIEHGKFKTIEEALDEAARVVRKWHPDGLALAPFERKVMRRIFPFYSWTRKTLPLVVESMVVNPGRVLLYPKVSYNYAKAAGVNPESFSVPFPEDQLFPSYFADNQLGPQFMDDDGQYHGINPGFPTTDLMNEFLPDFSNASSGSEFIRQMLGGPIGMLSPALKIPVEAVSGRSVATGAEVNDLGEYLDSQIPFVSKVSSVTGISPTGSIAQALPGGEAGVVDYRRSVEKGNRDPNFSIEAFLNYLLGVSSADMSTPSGITQAQIELRNKIGRERAGG